MKSGDFFHANTSCHAMSLTFNPLTLKVCGISGGTWSLSVLNLIEIEQPPAELFKFSKFLHYLRLAEALTFDP